ncbi:MAG: hypothetical protein P8J32_04250 [bacterium]|nr:hypothetical protein [bacterium]
MQLNEQFEFDKLDHQAMIDGGFTFFSISGYKPATYFDRAFFRLGSENGVVKRVELFESMPFFPGKPKMIIEVPGAPESLSFNVGA